MSETYAGTITELGGEELGKSGHAKPRKVVVKADPTAQYGKTFRVWQDSDAWERLSKLNGQFVTIIYEVEERQGGPSGTYTQNMIVGVDAADAPTNGSSNDWGPPKDNWGDPPAQEIKDPSLAAVSNRMAERVNYASKDDTTRQIEAAWALGVLMPVVGNNTDALHREAHNLIVLKHRIASELGE